MADLRGEQLKDSYQNVVTRGTGNKLENGNGVEFVDLDYKPSLSPFIWHNVKRYGAIGDGATDDTQALRAAHEEAGVGGIVYYPPGLYRQDYIAEADAYPDSQTVILDQGATIKANDDLDVEVVTSVGLLVYTGGFPKIYGGTLDGNKDNIDSTDTETNIECIEIDGCDDFIVGGVSIINHSQRGDGIDIDNVKRGTVKFCNIRDGGGWGIHCSINSKNINVIGNYVENCGFGIRQRGGIDQHSSVEGCVYIGNVCKDNRKNFEINGSLAYFDPSNRSIDTGFVEDSDTFAGAFERSSHLGIARLVDRKGFRNPGTTYINNNEYAVHVTVVFQCTSDDTFVSPVLLVGNTDNLTHIDDVHTSSRVSLNMNDGDRIPLNSIVPAGNRYRVDTFGDSDNYNIIAWRETDEGNNIVAI